MQTNATTHTIQAIEEYSVKERNLANLALS